MSFVIYLSRRSRSLRLLGFTVILVFIIYLLATYNKEDSGSFGIADRLKQVCAFDLYLFTVSWT